MVPSFSFALTVKLSAELDTYLNGQRQPHTTIKFNVSTGKEYINKLLITCGTEVAYPKLVCFVLFALFSQTSKLELAVYLIQTEEYNFCLAHHFCWMHREKTISMKEDLIDTFVPPPIRESSNGAAKHNI